MSIMLIIGYTYRGTINLHAATAINKDVFTFDDIKNTVESAVDGDTFNFYIKNDLTFDSQVLIKKRISINLINDSGSQVVLKIGDGGNYRHFSSGSSNNSTTDIAGVNLILGADIILDGGGTGGGIWISSSGGKLMLNGCTLKNCKSPASVNGGGVYVAGIAEKSYLIIDNARVENCVSGLGGGGIFGSTCEIILNSGVITGNTALNLSGAGICLLTGSNNLGSALTINGGEISQNNMGSNSVGGGIWARDAIVTINSGEIINNTADIAGGGIYMLESTSAGHAPSKLIINGGTIKGNKVRNFGAGIGIQSKISEFIITGGLITENEATLPGGSNQGGGIYYVDGTTLTMSGGKITNNLAGSGAGIFFVLSAFDMKGTAQIGENEATASAGGIYGYQGCTITISEKAKVINNKALCNNNPDAASRGGGGIALLSYGSVTTLTVKGDALITGNSAVSYGGGIWTYPVYGPAPVVNIEGGMIENNTANYGGGIALGEISDYTPTLTITGGIITKNNAAKVGGGVFAQGSDISVSDGTITDNVADTGNGGGIYMSVSSNLTTDNVNTVTGNNAPNGHGGGIYTEDTTYENLIISNQTAFLNNHASAAYTPPNDASIVYPNIKFASVSITTHPLNNYDINYISKELLTFHVTYDPNGGTGGFEGPDIIPGETDVVLSLEDTAISRTDYIFKGWNTKSDGSGASNFPGDVITLNSNVTLYAQWHPKPLVLPEEATKIPEPAQSPEPTQLPGAAQSPGPIKTPGPAQSPEPTETPKPLASTTPPVSPEPEKPSQSTKTQVPQTDDYNNIVLLSCGLLLSSIVLIILYYMRRWKTRIRD